MRVAYIGQKGIPATFGGVEFHVDRLSREMAERGHEVTVYVRNWYTNKELKECGSVKLVHIPTIKSKHLDASVHSFFCSVHALFGKYDIIHYHGIGPTFFALIPRIFRKHVVATIHRLDWDTEKWGKLAKNLLKIGEYISITIPQRTIAVSEDLKNYVKDKYGKTTIHLGHGTDLPQPKAPDLIKNKYDLNGKDYILFMARLVPEKRVDWLIKAYQNLIEKIPETKQHKLVIAGGSSATPAYVQKLQDMGKGHSNIIFTGYVTGKQKQSVFLDADIFFFPTSYGEGIPISVLEAMMFGLPVVTRYEGGLKDIFIDGRHGFITESKSPIVFSDLIGKLIDDISLRQDIAGFNYRYALEKVSASKVSKRIETIYTDLLSDKIIE